MALRRDAAALLSLVSDLVIVLDGELRVRGANAAVERHLGWLASALAGRPVHELIAPASRSSFDALVREARQPTTQRARELELRLLQCDGGEEPAIVALQRLEAEGDAALVLIARDASDRRKLRAEQNRAEQLEEANSALREAMLHAERTTRVKSEFLANVSHEIRTPMTAILGFADELLDEAVRSQASRETQDALRTIRRNGDYLLTLLNDILDLSKIESGRLDVERVTYSPIDVVLEVARLMRVRADAKAIRFDVEFATELPARIEGDPTRVRQILINLVGNGIKFTDLGSVRLVVALRESPSGPRIVFEVIDTGIGISSSDLAKLFRPFRQADGSTTRRYGGSGLGLTISKHLCELMDGTIDLESDPGRGTTFRVTLPTGSLVGIERVRAPAEGVDAPGGRARPETPRLAGRVLLVEDGRDNQLLLRRLLAKAGLDAEVCENGQQAVERVLTARAEDAPFALILMDMQMPIMDGYTATRLLRARGYEGAIVALTAHAMDTERARCMACGCDDFATKPIDRETFYALLSRHLGGAKDA